MANQVKYYDSDTAITSAGVQLMDLEATGYNFIEVYNDTGSDIIITFGANNQYLSKSNTRKMQAFASTGLVTASVTGADSTGNLFVQVSRG